MFLMINADRKYPKAASVTSAITIFNRKYMLNLRAPQHLARSHQFKNIVPNKRNYVGWLVCLNLSYDFVAVQTAVNEAPFQSSNRFHKAELMGNSCNCSDYKLVS